MAKKKQVIYLSGRITGLDNYKELFDAEQKRLEAEGHVVINPCILPEGLSYEEYMHIDFALIDISNRLHMLKNWKDSSGAIREWNYAHAKEKFISYQ